MLLCIFSTCRKLYCRLFDITSFRWFFAFYCVFGRLFPFVVIIITVIIIKYRISVCICADCERETTAQRKFLAFHKKFIALSCCCSRFPFLFLLCLRCRFYREKWVSVNNLICSTFFVLFISLQQFRMVNKCSVCSFIRLTQWLHVFIAGTGVTQTNKKIKEKNGKRKTESWFPSWIE